MPLKWFFFTTGITIKYPKDATGLYKRYNLFIIYFTSLSHFLYLKCINMLYNAQMEPDLCLGKTEALVLKSKR